MDRDECAGMLKGCRDMATLLVDRTLNYGDDASGLLVFLETALERQTGAGRDEPGTYSEAVRRGREMLAAHVIPQVRTLTRGDGAG